MPPSSQQDLRYISVSRAAKELAEEGIDVGVIDMHTLKPIDKDAIINAAKKTGVIITAEDHNTLGGLGSMVADVLMEAGVPARLKKIAIPDTFVALVIRRKFILITVRRTGIAKTVREFL